MNPTRRLYINLIALAIALLVMVGWSAGRWADQRNASRQAAVDTDFCNNLAQQIRQLQSKPAVAVAKNVQDAEMNRHVEAAARAAQMSSDSVQRISSEPPRRLEDGPYMETPTQLLLRDVSFQQLAPFLNTLVSQAPGLEVRALRLSEPPESVANDHWSVEITLTYLVYMPKGQSAVASNH